MERILLIGQTTDTNELISHNLLRNGYDVIAVVDSAGLFLSVKILKPDIVVLDAEISKDNPYSLCHAMRMDDATKYIPVLFLGYSEANNSFYKAIEAGADDYITKQTDVSHLLSRIKNLIRIKKQSEQLQKQYIELKEKDSLIQEQLKMAMNVQRSMLHDFNFEYSGIKFISKYLPAIEIGGDFYDIIKLNEDSVAVVIGDVSGHGISAALLTAMIKMMIKNLAPIHLLPSNILYHMNNEFIKIFNGNEINIYACMFYAHIDLKKKRMYSANAGQALPIFVDKNNHTATEIEIYGTPIGMMSDTTYDVKIMSYNEGDMILFLTDGLTDNLYKNNPEEFYTRLRLMLEDMVDDTPGEIIIDSLVSVFCEADPGETKKFGNDDVSLILAKL